MSCLLRRVFNRDSKLHAIPSGLLAGLAFGFFPDNTVALYVMWKSLQVSILILLQVVLYVNFPVCCLYALFYKEITCWYTCTLSPTS